MSNNLPSPIFYSITEASRILGVSPTTLRRWEEEGRLTPNRTMGGDRRYSPDDIQRILKSFRAETDQRSNGNGSQPSISPEKPTLPPLPPKIETPLAPPPPLVPIRRMEDYSPSRPRPYFHLALALTFLITGYIFFSSISPLTRMRLERAFSPGPANPIVDVNDALEYQEREGGETRLGFKLPVDIGTLFVKSLNVAEDALLNTARFFGTVFFGPGEDYFISPTGNAFLRGVTADEITVSSLTVEDLTVIGTTTGVTGTGGGGGGPAMGGDADTLEGQPGSYYLDLDNETGTCANCLTTAEIDESTLSIPAANADTLDFLDSTQFLRADTSDSFTTGTLTIADGTTLAINSSTTTIGNAVADLVLFNGRVDSDIIPSLNVTYDLGSAGLRWDIGFFDEIVVNTLSAGSSDIAGTTSSDFSINTDNPSADTQDATLTFIRGTSSPNAVLRWDSALDRYRFESFPVYLDDDLTVAGNTINSSTAPALTLAGADVTTAGDLTVTGNNISSSTAPAVTLTGANVQVEGDLTIAGGELLLTPLSSSGSSTEGTVYYDSDNDKLYVYANGAFQRVATDMTKYSANNAALANGSYVEIAHSQATNDLSLVAWYYDSVLGQYRTIENYTTTISQDLQNEFDDAAAGGKIRTTTVGEVGGSYIRINGNLDMGNGSDGAVTFVSSTNINTVNTIAGRVCADGGDAVNYSVTALTANTATLSSSPSSGCILANDKVLLINLQGTSTAYPNVGNYEILEVQSVVTTTVTFKTNKVNRYGDNANDDSNIGTATTNQRVMLQRIPQYTIVTINTGVNVTPSDWDGVKNGVLAFMANGSVTINGTGTINANGKGYRGGAGGNGGGGGGINDSFGTQGESTSGTGVEARTVKAEGGGGGGDDHNNSGGNGAGGGGGGYGTVGADGGNSSDGAGTFGMGGTTYGDAGLTDLYLGSAGGGGGFQAVVASGLAGSDGAGIVLIQANSVTVTGGIQANGTNGPADSGDGRGEGGGGSGGSVKLMGKTLSLGSSIVTATGGTAFGNGGAGGAGRVAIFYTDSRTGTTNPGAVETQSGIFPYGLYHSAAIPTANSTLLDNLRWESSLPATTKVSFQTRSGPAYNTELSADGNTVGLWHMNETSNGTCPGGKDVCDSSGNGNHGTAVGTAIETTNKRFGAAARNFNGANDQVTINSVFGLGTTNVTIEAWVYVPSVSDRGAIVKVGNAGYGIGVGNTNFDNLGNNLILLYEGVRWVNTGVAIGTGWHHVAMTINASGYPTAYLDGAQVYTDTIGAPSAPDTATYIGGYTGVRYFNGTIDEVRVSNTARSASEIRTNARFWESWKPFTNGTNYTLLESADTASNWNSTTLNVNDTGTTRAVAYFEDEDEFTSGNNLKLTTTGFEEDTGATLTTSLVSYWPLNESSGGTGAVSRADAFGSETLTDNGTTPSGTGKKGNDINPASANSEYLSRADDAALSTGNIDFTIAAWVNLTNKVAEQTIISKYDGAATTSEYLLRYIPTEGDKFQFIIFNGTTGAEIARAVSDISPSAGTWYFIVAWHNAATDTVNMKVNNGTTTSGATGGVGPSDTTATFRIGARGSTPAVFMNGQIDEVGFWKKVLSSQEMADLYDSGNANTYPASGQYAEATIASADISSYDYLTAWVRASQTGTVLRLGFGEAAATEQIEDITVDTANTWQKVYWDLADVAAASRNGVTKLRITNLTTAANTFYLDNVRTEKLLTNLEGGQITSTPNNYIQYRAILTTTNTNYIPQVENVSLAYNSGYRLQQPDSNTVRLYNYTGSTQNVRLEAIVFGADLAEWYPLTDNSIEAGDVVSISGAKDDADIPKIQKSTVASDPKLMGVISTRAGIELGIPREDRRLVGLAGRVPVKIAPDSAPISAGDLLTSSVTYPGMAQKLTQPGFAVAKALEGWDPESGVEKINSFISVSWADPGVVVDEEGDAAELVEVPTAETETPPAEETEPELTTQKILPPKIEAEEGIFQRLTVAIEAVFERITAQVAQIAEAFIQKLTVESLAIKGESVGQVVVEPGEIEKAVAYSDLTENDKIFFTLDRAVAVGVAKTPGEGFKFILATPVELPVTIDYWIVEQ